MAHSPFKSLRRHPPEPRPNLNLAASTIPPSRCPLPNHIPHSLPIPSMEQSLDVNEALFLHARVVPRSCRFLYDRSHVVCRAWLNLIYIFFQVYRHPSCLIKHRWEHTPQWREASKFVLSKHQQVQLLEASFFFFFFRFLPNQGVRRTPVCFCVSSLGCLAVDMTLNWIWHRLPPSSRISRPRPPLCLKIAPCGHLSSRGDSSPHLPRGRTMTSNRHRSRHPHPHPASTPRIPSRVPCLQVR